MSCCLRTMSKFAGLAGMRVGYGVFPKPSCRTFGRSRPPSATSRLASSVAAIASLDDLDYLNGVIARLNADREALADNLREIPGVEPLPTATNFILVRLPVADATPVIKELAAARRLRAQLPQTRPRYRRLSPCQHRHSRRERDLPQRARRRPSARPGCRMSQHAIAQPAVHRIRRAEIERETLETKIALALDIDGRGTVSAQTGVPFLDHMLDALCRHGRFDLDGLVHRRRRDGSASHRRGCRHRLRAGDPAEHSATGPASPASAMPTPRWTSPWPGSVVDCSGRPFLHFEAALPERASRSGVRRLIGRGVLARGRDECRPDGPHRPPPRPQHPSCGRGHLQGRGSRTPRSAPPERRPDSRAIHQGSPGMIAIVDYGAGNLRSIRRALEAAGAETVITDDPDSRRQRRLGRLPRRRQRRTRHGESSTRWA